MDEIEYQYDCSITHREEMYDISARQQKAAKIISVLKDYLGSLENLEALDVGSSTGIMTSLLSQYFESIVGVDIDTSAVEYAQRNFQHAKLKFLIQDGLKLQFRDSTFDVVICSHIYEHVPDSKKLLEEIYRVLKPGGVCFFAAGNRFVLIESHYRLPLLSVIPKGLAHWYLKLLGKGNYYYENHRSLFGLRRLVSKFDVIDYTKKIIADPKKYNAEEMVVPGSLKQYVILALWPVIYWLAGTYIWLLKK